VKAQSEASLVTKHAYFNLTFLSEICNHLWSKNYCAGGVAVVAIATLTIHIDRVSNQVIDIIGAIIIALGWKHFSHKRRKSEPGPEFA
jgi:hypothetical protein